LFKTMGALAVGGLAAGGCSKDSTTEPPVVASVRVTPWNPTLHELGATLQLAAEARDLHDVIVSGVSFTWSSDDSTKVRVSADGVVTAVRDGYSWITATAGGTSGVTLVRVQAVASVLVAPANPTLTKLGATVQLTATALDASDSVIADVAFAWASGDPSTVAVSPTGLATAVRTGSTMVTASGWGISGATAVTVRAESSVVVAPARPVLAPGATILLTATTLDERNHPVPGVAYTWSTSDAAVASVDGAGLVTAVANGSATITAVGSQGLAGSATVTVNAFLGAARRLGVGWRHACALTPSGAAYCWGAHSSNGLPPWDPHSTPTPVAGGIAFQSLSTSDPETCGLDDLGDAYCWQRDDRATAVASGFTFGSVAVGMYQDCGLTPGGVVYCWGGDYGASPVAVGSGLLFRAISTEDRRVCGVSEAGATYCWNNGSTLPTRLPTDLVFQSITSGSQHTCAVTEDGVAYCWGDNRYGQLGDGTIQYAPTPVEVTGGLTFQGLSAGLSHTCGVTSSGAAYCWGNNRSGQLGDGTLGDARSPVLVAGGVQFLSVSAGTSATCGLAVGGTAFCWGMNDYGQLGNGTEPGPHASPVAVAGGVAFRSISAGSGYNCGTSAVSTGYCWGANTRGQLGTGDDIDRDTPSAITGGLVFQTIGSGSDRTCGLAAGGAAYCWGADTTGQDCSYLWCTPFAISSSVPVAIAGSLVMATVSNGVGYLRDLGAPWMLERYSCGLTVDGSAYCWSRWGTPTAVPGGLVFKTVSAASDHACALGADTAAWCWGGNAFGELGDGTTVSRGAPVAVSGDLAFQAISTGPDHTCGLTTSGAVYCWGLNDAGQVGDGTTNSRLTPTQVAPDLVFKTVSAGYRLTCGVTNSNVAYCWGSNPSGELGTGSSAGPEQCLYSDLSHACSTTPVAVAGGLAFADVSAGAGQSCGVTTGGDAYCWGSNSNGQLGNGTTYSTSPVAVSGGPMFGARTVSPRSGPAPARGEGREE
jgi:alpha-tubulin suppressor-like RCC1 family protein/uncharacterized protein YjdB